MPSLYAMLSTLGTGQCFAFTNLGYSELRKQHCNVGNTSGSRDLGHLPHSWARASPFGEQSPGLAGVRTGFFLIHRGSTDPLQSPFTRSSFIPSDGAFTSCLWHLICVPWAKVADLDTDAEPAVTETRAKLPTHTAASSTQSVV